MPNEPLVLPELLAGLPEQADYDVVLAAIMATEGGRRFLTEFAKRNRNTDTAMVVSAIARVEAAIRGEAAPQPAASAGPGDLIEIAAALERIAAAVTARATRGSETAAAIERMQDIAFMLHERPLEPTLRDSFDAAVRELSAAAARSGLDTDAGDFVQALASRVREMIEARLSHQPAGTELFAVPADNGEALAQAVAALAESLPVLGEAAQPAAAPPSEAATAPADAEHESGPTPVEPEPVVVQSVAMPPVETPTVESVEAVAPAPEAAVAEPAPPPIEATAPPAAATDVVAVEQPAPPPPEAPEVFDSQAILSQAFSDDHFAAAADEAPAAVVPPGEEAPQADPPREEPPSQELPSQELPSQELPSQELPSQELPSQEPPRQEPPLAEPASEAAPPAQDIPPAAAAGPEEDLADLFEPQPEPTPAQPAEAESPPVVAAETPQQKPAEPAQFVPPPPLRAIPRPPLSDPLAAVRDLSEEELIALFS
jgi:hypothetical protein